MAQSCEAWRVVKSFKRYVYYSPDNDELCVVMKVPFEEKEIHDLYTVSYGFDNVASHHKNYLKYFLVKIGEL